jgi:hypothetical protein
LQQGTLSRTKKDDKESTFEDYSAENIIYRHEAVKKDKSKYKIIIPKVCC